MGASEKKSKKKKKSTFTPEMGFPDGTKFHVLPMRLKKSPNYTIKRSQFKKEEIGAGKRGTQLSVQPMKINVCYNKNPQNVFTKIQFYI